MLNLPRNIYVIALVMALSFTTTSMMVLISGLIGASIAPTPKLATLPQAMLIIGTAAGSIPAAMLMQKVGRKLGMGIGLLIALCGIGICVVATQTSQFWLFIIGSMLIGANAAFTQQGRFIILENADTEKQQADGLSLALLSSLAAAFLGPWLGQYGKDLITSPVGYTGSFVALAVVLALALVALSLFKDHHQKATKMQGSGRPLLSIISQPLFIVAAGSAAIGYGIMSLVMTTTPLNMHNICGYTLDDTALVIQSHIVAMYLPSLLTGALLKRGYRKSLLICGLALYFILSAIGYAGIEVMHFWWALVLLGIGWNLLFLTSTAILPLTYTHEEKFKAQAFNDFSVFCVQAIASFSAGWLLFNFGWHSILNLAIGASAFWLVLVLATKIISNSDTD